MKVAITISGWLICLILAGGCATDEEVLHVYSDLEVGTVEFAIDEIVSAAAEAGIRVIPSDEKHAEIILQQDPDDGELEPEGFKIVREGLVVRIVGADEAGVMYGGLELAEMVRLYGMKGIVETIQNPYMELRGTKFNIPLDVRTPSYSDCSDVAQHNLPEMWDIAFWKAYIDNLARYRYNLVSLWSLHPFPSMVEVPGYEEVALEDVLRSTTQWNEFYSLNGVGFDAPEILAGPDTVKKISMEEKIAFWKEVFAYGKRRNVDFVVITWNIFVYGTDGKYGITDDINNATTRDYFRKSIRQMLVTYPDLAGVGLTTGENMHDADFYQKEDWAYDTYGLGMLEAASEMPDRKFLFIHRQHMAGAREIADKFRPVVDQENVEFLFSFKYAQAHVYSAVEQPYHEKFVEDIAELKTLWTLRNDDIYQFRWGAPGFVRAFISNIPHEVSRGYYYGSDQWIWGREFLMKEPESPRQLEIVKHWYHWMMWGRLGYNPGMPDERFIAILQARFPGTDGEKLFEAWQEASLIYPVTTGFHWGDLDFKWYIEGCKSTPHIAGNSTGFHDVNAFINMPVHARAGVQSIPDFVTMCSEGGHSDLKSPLEVSLQLHGHADRALDLLPSLDAGDNKELGVTLHDIRTIALMGKYYAHKIAGSTYVALYRATGDPEDQQKAVDELTSALEYWKRYTESALALNRNPLWTNRVGYVDWTRAIDWAAEDIEIAKLDE